MPTQGRWHYNQKLKSIAKYLHSGLAVVGAISLLFAAFVALSIPEFVALSLPIIKPTISGKALDAGSTCEDRYLDLLKKYLTRYDFGETYARLQPNSPMRKAVDRFLAPRGLALVQVVPLGAATRAEGRDWPLTAETMIGLQRLDNLQYCIADVLRRRVPGDLIEAGAWRGGATIFMRAMLKVHNDNARNVWVADSFQGLPKPNPKLYPRDAGDTLWTSSQLAVPVEQVKQNFARYGLLDERVKFLVGWFSDTLPGAPIERLAVLRIDADMYQSTTEALRYLYPKLSVGGYVIIDDYGAIAACKNAVEDFRASQGITEELKHIDWTGVYWQRLR